jgi:non-specific serine/threonine protein kinase
VKKGPPRRQPPSVANSAGLPLQPGRLIGRERELSDLLQLLVGGVARLVTVTGPGGGGKTRLALAASDTAAASFRHGAIFVDLSSLRDAALVPAAIAATLDLHDAGSRPLLDEITDFLAERELLLVLDNFEHVLPSAAVVSVLLQGCPRLSVLVTSREPLRLRWEHRFPLAPLELPSAEVALDHERLASVPACALFIERARAADPRFRASGANAKAIAEICAHLDGLPLAIELAAARSAVLTPAALLNRLEHRLDLRGEELDRPRRHRGLRDAIAWSHELLTKEEQRVFRRLAVFAGGGSLGAVNAIAADAELGIDVLDRLVSLVEKGLLQSWPSDTPEPRFRLLETVREFALEQLSASGELAILQQRHARYYAALMSVPETVWFSAQMTSWADQLETELPNMRAALAWSLQSPDGSGVGLEFGSFPYFWDLRGHIGEARDWFARLLAAPGATAPSILRARCLASAAFLALMAGDHNSALSQVHEAVPMARAMQDVASTWIALTALGHSLRHVDAASAEPSLREAYDLAHQADYPVGVVASAWMLGECRRAVGDLAAARSLFEECLEAGRVRHLESMAPFALRGLAHLDWMAGDYTQAEVHLSEALRQHRGARSARGVADVLEAMAWNAASRGKAERCARLLGAAQAQRQALGVELQGGHVGPHEQAIRTARARLGPNGYAAAFKLGLETSADEANWAMDAPDEQSAVPFTSREREVISLLAQDHSNRQIAQALFIAERTVETHVTNILNKLGLRSRVQVSAWATAHGLVPG